MIKIGMMLFEDMTQLDLTGPFEIFSRFPESQLYLISKSLNPVRSDRGLTILPNTTFENCPEEFDVLFVPGGPGISLLLEDTGYLNFVSFKGNKARYVTSVCTGSIVLAACGLLKGYRATTHWLSIDLLKRFGIETKNERVVIDRNRITGGGVTSGIDFAFVLAAMLFGEQRAKEIQLLIEYNPQPPFSGGHPDVADHSTLTKVKEDRKEIQRKRLDQIDQFIRKNEK